MGDDTSTHSIVAAADITTASIRQLMRNKRCKTSGQLGLNIDNRWGVTFGGCAMQ
ncbi:unnamed protein product [Gongylonema pulchrum]|uniref:Uncharacterized protein n=1 Tax=Gongylonema pulchrum TaxID=637853 RepID=A0A3P7MZF9_9BILA|nr:unnamed protein product [Gongylonema pulchrum]